MNLSRMHIASVSLMLFSMFFGAGNLIFPTMIGYLAGKYTVLGVISFSITAVLLPILALHAVFKNNGFDALASRVHPYFSRLFLPALYLISGPLLSVPRAGIVPFEIAFKPLLQRHPNLELITFCYTVLFFAITYYLCLNPERLGNVLGKLLTPMLLVLIFVVLFGCIWNGLNLNDLSQQPYHSISSVLTTGFLDGYLTLDALGALNLGMIVIVSLREYGVSSQADLHYYAKRCGLYAGLLLLITYLSLGISGQFIASEINAAPHGAAVIASLGTIIFGSYSPYLLGSLFILACLTTCVGLICCATEYFSQTYPIFSYRRWLQLLVGVSLILANIGLERILKITGPVLSFLYPMGIMVILLGLIRHASTRLMRIAVCTSGLVSALALCDTLIPNTPFLSKCLQLLPFYSLKLSWVMPTIVLIVITLLIEFFVLHKNTDS